MSSLNLDAIFKGININIQQYTLRYNVYEISTYTKLSTGTLNLAITLRSTFQVPFSLSNSITKPLTVLNKGPFSKQRAPCVIYCMKISIVDICFQITMLSLCVNRALHMYVMNDIELVA